MTFINNILKNGKKYDLIQIHLALGFFLHHNEQYNDAIETYKTILDKGLNADIYYAIGLAYKSMYNLEDAIDSFRKSINENPEPADVYISLADSLYINNQESEAIEILKQQINNKNIDISYERKITDIIFKMIFVKMLKTRTW